MTYTDAVIMMADGAPMTLPRMNGSFVYAANSKDILIESIQEDIDISSGAKSIFISRNQNNPEDDMFSKISVSNIFLIVDRNNVVASYIPTNSDLTSNLWDVFIDS